MGRVNKYIYWAVLQEWTGYDWEDSVLYDTADAEYRNELRSDLIAYRNENIRTRVIHRRTLNQ